MPKPSNLAKIEAHEFVHRFYLQSHPKKGPIIGVRYRRQWLKTCLGNDLDFRTNNAV